MQSGQLSCSLPKPWGSLFYYPSAAFRPFPSPLQAIAQSRPSALVLFSLSPRDEGLIINVFVGSESDKARLRDQLWGGTLVLPGTSERPNDHAVAGAIIRFTHPYDASPFTQSATNTEAEDEITLAGVPVRVVALEVLTAGDGPIEFDIVPENNEPISSAFRQFVEKRVWELEMGEQPTQDGASAAGEDGRGV